MTVTLEGGPYDGQLRAIHEGNALSVERLIGGRLRQTGEYRPVPGARYVWRFMGWQDVGEAKP